MTVASKIFGIDISKYQKGIDFDKIASDGVKFVILRGAYHLSKDVCFEEFYKKAKEKNFPVGVYVYTMAKTTADAVKEADFLIENVLKDKRFELPIYFDIEDKIYSSKSKAENTDIVKSFCSELEKNGYFAGIYASKSFFSDRLNDDKLKSYTHWVAQWNKTCSYADKSVLGMWQFGGETNKIRSNKIAGMVCDQNYMLTDFPALIKSKKLNGFDDKKEFIPNVSGYFKKGDTGIGVYLLKQNIALLKEKGKISQRVDNNDIFGDGTEIAVKQIQTLYNLEPDGFAGVKTVSAIKNLLSAE